MTGLVRTDGLEALRELYRIERCDHVCDNVMIRQAVGELTCVRLPGHYGDHWSGPYDDERWT